jgi:hypothetical protein
MKKLIFIQIGQYLFFIFIVFIAFCLVVDLFIFHILINKIDSRIVHQKIEPAKYNTVKDTVIVLNSIFTFTCFRYTQHSGYSLKTKVGDLYFNEVKGDSAFIDSVYCIERERAKLAVQKIKADKKAEKIAKRAETKRQNKIIRQLKKRCK